MTGTEERRQFWRAAFRSPVRLKTRSGNAYGDLIDISLKGVLFGATPQWQALMNEEYQIRLELAPGATINLTGTVVHIDGQHIGLRTDSIDIDSITHLRRLVELNAGDPAILEREISALVSGSA